MKKYIHKIRWGILGTGRIAHTFAEALSDREDAELYAVASRTAEKAADFSEKFGFFTSYGSYVELAEDENVDVIYIATPMSLHYHDAKLCLEHGKNVLCEKSVTINTVQLKELLSIAEQKELFFMEAMWMKCRPTYRKAMEWCRNGRIGSVRYIKADFSNFVPYDAEDRLFRTDCGGGALLDLSIYPLTLIQDVLEISESIINNAHIRNGIDLSNTILLRYADGTFASSDSGFEIPLRNNAVISGSDGLILFGDCFLSTEEVHLYDRDGNLLETYSVPDHINGYEYEIEEVIYCLQNGCLESSLVPHQDTLEVMKIMDECRRQWNMQFQEESRR